MKRTTKFLILALIAFLLFACGGSKQTDGKVIPISREEGSGTRTAFVELFGVLDANKNDITTINAEITNNTAVMISSVETNKRAIGYVSMGSMSDVVKAANINGVAATAENVTNGTYEISRPFIIATKDGLSDLASDFVNFILSADGQKIVVKSGYIGASETEAFVASNISGKIVVAGSSSVAPLMEKLKEAYLLINPNATIEIQTSDSSTGVKNAENGICDIAMSSRALKPSELEKGLKPTTVAIDGIAVIVNKQNPSDNFSKEQIKSIFTGKTFNWSDVKQ
jgi:phosphate transport system substrate-binding protein